MTGNRSERLLRIVPPLRVEPARRVSMPHDFDPRSTGPYTGEATAARDLKNGVEALTEHQARLAAMRTHGILLVLQGLDGAGKDGVIKHVMSGLNPTGVRVRSFKAPSAEEAAHDYLWRHQLWLPARGEVAVFNRSHYEEVLVVRVHPELLARERLPADARGDAVWHHRYRQINEWEHSLVENGIHIVKVLLNISREEQRRRFLQRIDDPTKWWKFSAADARERHWWDEYQKAYSDMLSHTSTPHAPWHVVPADHKWFARLAVAAILEDALSTIDPKYPEPSDQTRRDLAEARAELLAEK